MTTRKKGLLSKILTAVILVLVLSMVAMLLVQCGPDEDEGNTPDDGNNGNNPVTVAGPEAGAYYFDAGVEEYTLTLGDGNSFTLSVKGQAATGTYTLTDGALSLDFAADGKETVNATLSDNVVTMTYEGATMRFLKKITYTVNFETNGGNAVAAASVLNGKTLAKPADPTRENFVFVGWYADSEFKTPFAFDAQPISGNTTLYARWSETALGGVEYTVSFDANYENGENLADRTTTGGKLFNLPTLSREGYTFAGWWLSMTGDGSKLTARYEEGTALNDDAVLFALWQENTSGSKLSAPVVNVTASTISWDAVNNARSYQVTVKAPDGSVVLDQSVSGTTLNVAFVDLAAGEYEIKVVANAQTGEANNSEAVRYYTNKALDRVTVFEVVDSMLLFNGVEHAEKYLITVVCGNPDHKHTGFDNGASRTFNFANCTMPEGGIRFTVTAVADGYASSTSAEFVFKKALSAVENLHFDNATQTVTWDAVTDASYYMVSVQCGNAAHHHGFVNNGNATSVSLKGCEALAGGIIVKVYPKTNGYASPAATELKVEKTLLATPTDLRVVGTTLNWNAVTGATKYEVQIGTAKYEATTNSFDLSAVLNGVEGTEYTISVRAMGETESLWSDAVTARYNAFNGTPKYAAGSLSWVPVIGATSYEIQVNDGDIIKITDGATKVAITLTKAGVNTIKLRFAEGSVYSEFVTVEVFAHTVLFDTRGGSYVEVQYKAVGDMLELPTTTKTGYNFVAWYNVPGGPAVNGKVYTDGVFEELGSISLYAYYTPVNCTVTYNYGVGGSGDKQTDLVPFEGHYQLIVPTPDNNGIVFGGWFTSPYGTGIQLTDGKGNSLSPWTVLEGAEVHAYWIDETLTFTPTKVNGKDAYMVSAGARFALLSEVTIPATYNGLPVAMIAGNAFLNCSNLKVLNLPATLEQISLVDPFAGCAALEAINVYEVEGNTSARFWSQDGVLFDNGTGTVATSKLAVMPMGKTGAYVIPEGVTELPEFAFANSKLSKVTVPASVTLIGNSAFENCTALLSVVFAVGANEQPLTIGNKAFNGCTALASIVLPARLENIALNKYKLYSEVNSTGEVEVELLENGATHAFVGCTALTSITVLEGNKTYKSVDGVLYSADGKTLLYCPVTKTGAFVVPTGTQVIAPGAFVDCQGITEVTLPNTLTLVGEAAFAGLDAEFVKVTVAGNAFNDLIIDQYAFLACEELEEIVLEEGSRLAELGEGAFYGCESITTFTVPATMTKIGAEAFRECTMLESVTFASSDKELVFGERAFYGCEDLITVSLPANVSSIPGIFFDCENLQEILVDENSPYLTSEDGVVFNKDMTEILFYPAGKAGDYTIPVSVKKIGSGAFAYVDGIKTLTIYNTVEEIAEDAFRSAIFDNLEFVDHETEPSAEKLIIGEYSFANTKIGRSSSAYKPLVLPGHTTVIGEYAFYNTKFTTFSWGNAAIVEIGAHAFQDSGVSGKNTIPVVIPATVKRVGDYAFEGSYTVITLVLSEGIEEIGVYAFSECDSLQEVTIPASVKKIDAYAFSGSSKLKSILFADNSQLTTIGAFAFQACGTNNTYKFKTITIPASVCEIGAYAFTANTYLEEVIFEENEDEANAPALILGSEYIYTKEVNGVIESIPVRGRVFGSPQVKGVFNISAPNTNKAMKSVVLPGRLTEIGEYCFYKAGASGATITLPANSRLQTIGTGAFEQSLFSGELILPNTLRNLDPVVNGNVAYDRLGVGAYAFYQSKFEKIVFAAGGTAPLTIGELAFGRCTALTEIVLPATLADYTSHTGEVIEALQGGAGVFGATDQSYNNTDNHVCNALTSITVQTGANARYTGADGILYKTNGTHVTELIMCPVSHNIAVTIPGTVTKIADHAFFGCAQIPAIIFEGGKAHMTIGDQAFYGCAALTELVLPNNVVSIGDKVFYGCSELAELTLSVQVKYFEGSMVDACTKLSNVHVGSDGYGIYYNSFDGVLFTSDMKEMVFYPAARENDEITIDKNIAENTFAGNKFLKEVIIAEGVTEIGANAFYGSSIQKITIPSTVTLIGDSAFQACRSLTEVIFVGEGVEPLRIGDMAFMFTTQLKAITFPAHLLSIGAQAFKQNSYNTGLSSISFAENCQLKSIGDAAFAMTNLQDVVLPVGIKTMGSQVFYDCMKLVSVEIGEGLVSIGDQTFGLCTALVEVHFPSTLRTMGVNTFFYGTSSSYQCKKLSTVTFGENPQLEAIPAGTFAYCPALTEFVVPDSVKAIAYYDIIDYSASKTPGAFDHCTKLTAVIFGENAQCSVIGAYAFNYCSALTSFTIPTTVTTLSDYALSQTGLTELVIPETCTNFGGSVLKQCTKLKTVVLNTKGTALAQDMFSGCSALTEIVIPESVTDLSASHIFNKCSSLQKVVIKGAVTVLGRYVFSECKALAEVKLPDTLEVISTNAFYYCESLASITLPAALHTIGSSAFSLSGLAEYIVAEGNTTFASREGALFSADLTQLLAYPANRTSPSFTIPKELTEIGAAAFKNITALQNVYFEENGTADLIIGKEAFYGCFGLLTIVLPERVTVIGESAFENCENLMSIHLPSTLRKIEDFAFRGCDRLVQVGNYSAQIKLDMYEEYDTVEVYYGMVLNSAVYYYTQDNAYRYMGEDADGHPIIAELAGGDRITTDENGFVILAFSDTEKWLIDYLGTETEVVVPEGVTDIYAYAFDEYTGRAINGEVLGMTKVTFPNSLIKLHSYAFNLCKSLTEIVFGTGLKEIGYAAFNTCQGFSGSDLGLPAGIEIMGDMIFNNGTPSRFYVQVSKDAIPEGWKNGTYGSDRWYGNAEVVYDWSGEEITYTFVVDPADESLNLTHTALYNFDVETVVSSETYVINGITYHFGGWFEDAACTKPAEGLYYDVNGLTFYAKLYTEEEWEWLLNAGTSFDWAWELELKKEAVEVSTNSSNTKKTYEYHVATVVEIETKGQLVYYKFVATEDGTCIFQGNHYTSSNVLGTNNSYGYVYDADRNLIDDDTGSLGKSQFQIEFEVEAGKTYYFVVKHDRATGTGDLPVILLFEPVVVAKIGDTAYATLQAAVEAANENDVITLAGDFTGAGVVINKSITIDFNGYTYTLNAPVGSTGTESNGFQILQGNTVTLKGGKLEVAEESKNLFYMLVQNYANLTVTDMILDGTNLDKYSLTDGDSYTLSNNSGIVNINGETTIIANNDGDLAFAFDACEFGGYEVPTVNVNTTGTITGAIEVSGAAVLAISGGTFTVEISEAWCAEGFVPAANEDGTYTVVAIEAE